MFKGYHPYGEAVTFKGRDAVDAVFPRFNAAMSAGETVELTDTDRLTAFQFMLTKEMDQVRTLARHGAKMAASLWAAEVGVPLLDREEEEAAFAIVPCDTVLDGTEPPKKRGRKPSGAIRPAKRSCLASFD